MSENWSCNDPARLFLALCGEIRRTQDPTRQNFVRIGAVSRLINMEKPEVSRAHQAIAGKDHWQIAHWLLFPLAILPADRVVKTFGMKWAGPNRTVPVVKTVTSSP